MAQTKRKVNRSGAGGRQALVRRYNQDAWYELPAWFKEFLAANTGWIALGCAVLLAPVALLATVLGVHALPLPLIGVPLAESDNSVGLTAAVFLLEFVLLVLAVRPLFNRKKKGWNYLIAVALVQLVHNLLLNHIAEGIIVAAIIFYLNWQTRRYFA